MISRCKHCNQDFDDLQRTPKLLDCQHNLCLACCNSSYIYQDYLMCPFDLKMFLVPIKELQADQEVLTFRKQIQIIREKQSYFQNEFQRLKEYQSQSLDLTQLFRDKLQNARNDIEQAKEQLILHLGQSKLANIDKTCKTSQKISSQIYLNFNLFSQKQIEISNLRNKISLSSSQFNSTSMK